MAQKLRTLKKHQKKKMRIDPIYQSMWFSKFINKFMRNGKKFVVEKIIYESFDQIKTKIHRDPLKLFFKLLRRLKPIFGFISKRLGKEWKRIPIPIKQRQQYILALKWLVRHIKSNPEATLETRLVYVFKEVFKKKKTSLFKYRRQYHVDIVKERVNTRFRWK